MLYKWIRKSRDGKMADLHTSYNGWILEVHVILPPYGELNISSQSPFKIGEEYG